MFGTSKLVGNTAWGRWLEPRKSLVSLLIFALLVRVVWMLAVDSQPVTDFDWYFERAKGIADGVGYSHDGQRTAYWPVGYPAALSLVFKVFGSSVLAGKILSTILVMVSLALAWDICRSLFKDKRVADWTLAVLTVHPAFVAYSGLLASEPLYTALTLAGTKFLLQSGIKSFKFVAVSGFFFGLATLTRPIAAGLPLLTLLSLKLPGTKAERPWRDLVLQTVFAYVALGCVVLPWTVRNFHVFGKPVFVSTNGGDNLWIGNNPQATGKYINPYTLSLELRGLSETDRDSLATKSATDYIKSHPMKTLRLWPAKIVNTYLVGSDAPYWAFQKTKGHLEIPGKGDDKALFLAFRAYSNAVPWILSFGFLFAVFAGLRKRELPLIGIASIAYTGVVAVVFFGNPRFAFAVVPYLVMHSMQGLVWLVDRFRTEEPSLLGGEAGEIDFEHRTRL